MSTQTIWLKVERVRMVAYKLTRCLNCSAFFYKMVKITNPPIEMPTSDIIDKFTLLWILLLILFLYVAKGYPSWRKTRSLNLTDATSIAKQRPPALLLTPPHQYPLAAPASPPTPPKQYPPSPPTDATSPASTSCSSTVASAAAPTTAAPTAIVSATAVLTAAAPITSTKQPPRKASESHKLWLITFLPIIIPYLIVRASFDLFRLSVYILLEAIEWTGVALAKFALHAMTESLPRTIEALGVWLHHHGLPALRFLGQKLRECGMLALARACEGAFYWTVFCWVVFLCVRAAAWAQLIGTRLYRFWVEIGKPWLDKILAGAKFWVLDPLIWVVTRGVYLVLILYKPSTLLAVAVWNEMALGQFITWLAVWVWESGISITSKIVQAWTLATVQIQWMARFALDGIVLYKHLISEMVQRFLIGLGKILAATAIFFVTWIQFLYAGIPVAMHWTHTHIVLPPAYFLSDTYRRLSSAIVSTYIHLTSTIFIFAARFITFLWSVPEYRDFICNCLARSAILLYDFAIFTIIELYNITNYIITAFIKQSWRALTGPMMQQFALALYGYLSSETTQKFRKRSAAAAIFWGQKSIRTTIFFVIWIQFLYAEIPLAMHWTRTYIVLPPAYFLSDTYRRLSSAIFSTYIHLTSIIFIFAARFITFLWSVPEYRDFICNCLIRSAILLCDVAILIIIKLYNVTNYIITAFIKQSWRALTGPTMQHLALVLYGYLSSETTQKFLVDLSKRSAAAAIFWGQKSIRTAIFLVTRIQFVCAKTLVAWHWTHTHVVLPLSYLLPDTYRQLLSASVGVYIHVTSYLGSRAFIYNHLVHRVIFLVTALITHVHLALVRAPVAIKSLVTECYTLCIGPAYGSVQAHVVIIAVRVAELAGLVLTKAVEAAGHVYERLVTAREQLARQADRVVEWVGNTLMEWLERETANESMSKGEKGKAE